MKFRFPNITPGYLCIKQDQLTLNSAFYSELFSGNYNIDNLTVFPQRVPKKEFFDEILLIEINSVDQLFRAQQNKLIKNMNNALTSMKNNNEMQRAFLNWLNILLRYGLASEICSIDETYLYSCMNPSDLIEFKLIREIANFRIFDGKPSDTSITNLVNLANQVISSNDLNRRIQILILNYLIVIAYRFGVKLPYQGCLENCCEKLVNLIEHEIESDFGAMIRISVAYRGLAMVNEIDISLRHQYVSQAELIARNIKPNNKLEDFVKKENLYTCLQTLSKWNQHTNLLDFAKSNLIEMIELDPFDSTGYAELAFFLLNQDHFEEASHYFKRAAELGPPAVGMHTYYYAKSLQFLGKNDEAVNALYDATKIDEQAVSPWLDLIEHYLELDEIDRAKPIIIQVLNKPMYKNQLEEDEKIKLKSLLEQIAI